MPEEIREHILANAEKPAVRFKGVKLGGLAEKMTIQSPYETEPRTENWRWSLYKTQGGSYVIQLVKGSESYHKHVEVCKMPGNVLSWIKRQNPEDPKPTPKDWSPRIDFGVSEEQMKFLIDADPKFKDLFFRDVE